MILGFLLLAVGILCGCAAALPHGERKVVSQWTSFEEAKLAFDQITPYRTKDAELRTLGFSPSNQPNVRILNHADLAERFMLLSLNAEDLPRGVKDCLDHSAGCYAYEVQQRETHTQRYGNFLADFLNFKRKTETRGWEFQALVLMVNDLVVYKLWGGTPEIHEYSDQTNPLGPLQGIGPALTPRPQL